MGTSAEDAHAGGRWWHGPFAVFQSNLQEIDAGMDVESALDVVEAHGANAWLLNTGGIISNHPTDLPFQTRNPHLADRPSGDLVGDAVAAAHRRGIRLLARFDLSKVAAPIAREHPEWCFRTHDGRPQVYQGLWSVCPSGGYYQERSFEIIDEVLSRYPVDGVFVNWFNFNMVDYSRQWYGVCHCDACVDHFREWSGGADLPVDPRTPAINTWSTFSQEVLSDLNRRLTDHIHAASPDALVVLGKRADMRYAEQGKMFGKELWPHAAGDQVSELRNHEPPVPAFVNGVSFVDMPYRMAGEEPAQFAQYLAQGIARGGMPSTYIMGAPGRIPYPSLEVAGEITRFFRRHESLYRDLTSAARIALVKATPARLGAAPSDEYLGVYSMLQRGGYPFDVLPQDQITKLRDAGRLAAYPAVILPDVGSVEPHAAALDAYVRQGGHLVTTGDTAVAADGTAELASSPARARSGGVRRDQELWSTYATTTHQERAADHVYHAPLVAIFGKAYDCEWDGDAQLHGETLPAAPHGPPEKAYGHIASRENPAYGRRFDSGGGSVTSFPWTIGTSYREVETSPAQEMFLSALDEVFTASWRIEAPEQIEVVAGRSGDDLVLHLINLTGASRRGFRPPAPVPGVRVLLPETTARTGAEALVSGETPTIGPDGVLDLDVVGDFEVLRITGGAGIA
ncbi:alpha-amylase family protein [Myceligenerans pegani]|uniref:Beta-galactosidase n=1 Tax=Myceligenerans pegani TaxID=2776917 RepID=A0ABR9N3R2_9MICO|nr:alpha-amylase family protein [Myceligenerans sp. TRM 65318]MBE1878300.1 beta-galactosidase [Myceligenerans sp. TRM 65318]MBE3020571.1 beta-galactosidase [Myceligenerans sp. TRM 65318]